VCVLYVCVMKFRPCIDLHNGQVKQIVGSTLTTTATGSAPGAAADAGAPPGGDNVGLTTNFVATQPAEYFGALYRRDGLLGGHVIMLGPSDANKEAARAALASYPHGLHIGGGITNENALEWLEAGASHVIVTSHVFKDGHVHWDRLQQLCQLVTKERLVLDLSCRKRQKSASAAEVVATDSSFHADKDDEDDLYYVVTDQWQRYTDTPVTRDTLHALAEYCSEFLVHGVDVEGLQCGILTDLVTFLGEHSPIPVTYAGGVRSLADLELVSRLGRGRVDCTVGSALDIFGGPLSYDAVVAWHHVQHSPTTSTTTSTTTSSSTTSTVVVEDNA
jgi:phosphoribosylformimino-5-aminoimidazole carboxamide ribotide isomerase